MWQVKKTADGQRYAVLAGEPVAVFSRAEFLASIWAYDPGDHVFVCGPTQSAGKTRLIFDLLGATDTTFTKIPPTMLVAKPRDEVVRAGIAKLDYREIDQWPPKRRWFTNETPPGYAFWPKHLRGVSAAVNNRHLAAKFAPVIQDVFWEGDTILVVDELHAALAGFDMGADVDRHLTQGDGMGSAIWYGTQKPSGTRQASMSGFVFNSATHTFIARDPVEDNQRRFREISGVPGKVAAEAAAVMPFYHFLYVHRNGPKYCVIEDK